METGLAKHSGAAPALAFEWLRDARVGSDLERPRAVMRQMDSAEFLRGRTAVARIHLEGLTGEYHPGLAAEVCGRIPDRGRWLTFAMQREVAPVEAWLALQPTNLRFRFGRTGQRLLEAARENRDPLAVRALRDLGVKEKDWDRLRRSR